jgi:hypothetical protein
VECNGADRDGDRRGWRAEWGGGHDGEELELVILCPECWDRDSASDLDDDARCVSSALARTPRP